MLICNLLRTNIVIFFFLEYNSFKYQTIINIQNYYNFKENTFIMPLIAMKEIITPLKLVNIKIFKSSENEYYIKYGKRPRKKLFGNR